MNKKYASIPNLITLSRILLIFPIFLLLQNNLYPWAFAVTGLALFTDFIDGQVARKSNYVTISGSILDPVADKIFVFCLLYFFTSKNLLSPTYFAISSTRDLLQLLAIPLLIGFKKIKFNVKPKLLPKIATALKYLVIMMLFSISTLHLNPQPILLPVLFTSALIEIYILYRYLIRFFQVCKGLHDTFE